MQIDPETGAVKRTIRSDRFVTGVAWHDGALWHASAEDDARELRRIDADSGEVLERLEVPGETPVTGLATDGRSFYCGGGRAGVIRKLRRP